MRPAPINPIPIDVVAVMPGPPRHRDDGARRRGPLGGFDDPQASREHSDGFDRHRALGLARRRAGAEEGVISTLLGRHRVTPGAVRRVESAPSCPPARPRSHRLSGRIPARELRLLNVEVLLDVFGRQATQADTRPDARGDQRHRQPRLLRRPRDRWPRRPSRRPPSRAVAARAGPRSDGQARTGAAPGRRGAGRDRGAAHPPRQPTPASWRRRPEPFEAGLEARGSPARPVRPDGGRSGSRRPSGDSERRSAAPRAVGPR